MRKYTTLLMIACAALIAGFTSCSDDTAPNSPIGNIPNGKPTVAHVSLTTVKNTTRATTAPTTAAPTAEEKKINTATMYIFNSYKEFVKQVDMTVAGDSVYKTVEISTGTHYFFALVNCPQAVPVFSEGTSISAAKAQLDNLINLEGDINKITKGSTGFLMTTVGDPTSATLIESTEAEAPVKNKVVLYVGRAMVKVNVLFIAENPETDFPPTGRLDHVEYLGANNPNKMFILPSYQDGVRFVPEQDAGYFPTLTTDNSMTGFIPADGNEENAIYMVENSNEDPKVGNSSFILVKATFLPNADYCYSGTDGNALGVERTGTFWCIVDTDGVMNNKAFFFDERPTDEAINNYKNNHNDAKDYPSTAEFTDGITYYPFFLRRSDEPTRRRQFTAPRNNYFGITLTGARDIGYNTPKGVIDGPGEDTPLGTEAWMYGYTQVVDWTTVAVTGPNQPFLHE